MILDIFSRYVVGWLLAERESAELANRLIRETIVRQGVSEEQLTLHSDRGPSMTSKAVAQLLADLGVTKSHTRPYTSNDNAYSESQFRTLKYRPAFPKRFGSHEDALSHCRGFFRWYNHEHHHSGVGLMTPYEVHSGQTKKVYARRTAVLQVAYQKNPERFVRTAPKPPRVPTAVWINPPPVAASSSAKSLPLSAAPQRPPAPVDLLLCHASHTDESQRPSSLLEPIETRSALPRGGVPQGNSVLSSFHSDSPLTPCVTRYLKRPEMSRPILH